MMNSKFQLILVVILVFGLGNARSAYAAPPSPGCSLLTPAQIEKVLGQTFDAPEETPLIPPFGEKWGSHCTYRAQKGGDHATVVDFFVYMTASPSEAKQWFEIGATAKPKSKPAIGDSAHIDGNGEIHVLKGKILFWIDIDPGNEKKASDLAASIAARI